MTIRDATVEDFPAISELEGWSPSHGARAVVVTSAMRLHETPRAPEQISTRQRCNLGGPA